jgi:hypothetical protein
VPIVTVAFNWFFLYFTCRDIFTTVTSLVRRVLNTNARGSGGCGGVGWMEDQEC